MDFSPTQPLIIQDVATGHADVKAIRLIGPVTIHNLGEFQAITKLDRLPPILLVDLSEVPYIDSSALGIFVTIHVSCEQKGRRYAFVGANQRLLSLFELACVQSFLVLYDSLAQAEAILLQK